MPHHRQHDEPTPELQSKLDDLKKAVTVLQDYIRETEEELRRRALRSAASS